MGKAIYLTNAVDFGDDECHNDTNNYYIDESGTAKHTFGYKFGKNDVFVCAPRCVIYICLLIGL